MFEHEGARVFLGRCTSTPLLSCLESLDGLTF